MNVSMINHKHLEQLYFLCWNPHLTWAKAKTRFCDGRGGGKLPSSRRSSFSTFLPMIAKKVSQPVERRLLGL